MSDVVAARLVVQVGIKQQGVSSFLQALERQLESIDKKSMQVGRGLGKLGGLGGGGGAGGGTRASGGGSSRASTSASAALLRQERDALALAQAYARADAAAGNYSGAIARLSGAMQNATVVNVRQGLAVQQQIGKYQQAADAAAKSQTVLGRIQAGLGDLGTIAGASFLGVGIQQVAAFGQEAVQLSQRTQLAKNALQALAGSPALYADALAAARQQQKLFGGSLAENIEGIQGLITVSRSSGVELSKLIDLSQRLSLKDPSQGVSGARVALNEALAGDPTSLARRYEIPKAALAALRDESISGAEKLQVIDQYLNDIGITSEVVGGSIPQATIAFNSLNAELETLKTTAGDQLSAALGPVAGDLAAILSGINGIQAATSGGAGLAQFQAQMQGILLSTQPLTQQFSAIITSLSGLRTTMEALGLIQDQEAIKAQQAAAAQAAHDATVQALARSYAEGRISLAQYDQGMAQLQGSTQAATGGIQQAGAAAEKSAAQMALDEVASKLAAAEKDALAEAAQAAAGAIIASGGDIEATAARLAASSSQIDQLTAAYLRLAIAQGAAAREAGKQRLAGQAANTRDLTTGGIGFNAPGRRGNGDPDAVLKTIEENKKATEAAAEAQRAYQEQVGGTSTVLANLQKDLAATTVGSAEYYDTLRRIDEAQDTLARESAGKRGGAAKSENDKLLAGQQDYQGKALDAAREYEQSRAEIAAEGARKRAEAEDKYAQDNLDGRASFYRDLANVEDNATRQQLSARYEQAQQEANQIAATQGADAALAYMNAQRQAIQDQSAIEADIAKARADGDENQAKYLEGVLELQKAADARRIEQIKNAGSEIAAQEAAQYSEAEARYAAHLDEMARIYQEKFGGAPPGVAPPGPGAGLPPPSSSASATGTTSTARPAAGAEPVRQDGATLVTDPATQAAIDAMGARLEAQIGAVVAGLTDVGGKVEAVERAVGRINSRSVVAP